MRANGYYWIHPRTEPKGDNWQIAKWDSECGWFVPGLTVHLSDDYFSEIDERQIVRDVVSLNKGVDIMNIRFKVKEGDGFNLVPQSIFFHEKGASIVCAYDKSFDLSPLIENETKDRR